MIKETMFFPDKLWQANWFIRSLALPNSFSPQKTIFLIPEWFVFLCFYLLSYFFVLGFVQLWDNRVHKIYSSHYSYIHSLILERSQDLTKDCLHSE